MPLPKPAVAPPLAAVRPAVARHHGIELVDPYAWMRNPDWHEAIDDPGLLAPEIKAHLDAENAYSKAALAATQGLRARLLGEMRGRIAEEDSTVPEPDGAWSYYESFASGAEHAHLCRVPTVGGAAQLLLDCDKAANGKPFWSLEEAIPSPDHRLLAYTFDPTGSERCSIRIRDLGASRNLPDRVSGVAGDLAWSADSRSLFYVHLDQQQRPMQVRRHVIGTPVSADTVVYEERDPVFEVSVGVTQSARFILIETHAHDESEIRILDAGAPDMPLLCVAPRTPGHQYRVDHHAGPAGDTLVIATNSAGAADFRICTAPLSGVPIADWREIVPHRPGCRIIDVACYARHFARLEREDGQPRLVIHRWLDGAEHAIGFTEDAFDLRLEAGLAYDTDTTRFVYSSMTTPDETFDYDMEARSRTLRKRRSLPTGHDPRDYVTRRLHARAADGEAVPVSVLYHRSTRLDGTAPLLLQAYGAYGVAIDADFDPLRLSLVDRGVVFALAHVRGGEDKGEHWHAGGKLRHKRNTFTDYIAVAEHLIAAGFTARGRIIAHGESAGGLLVGAVANMAPGLLLGIIADVPFVDVLNTMLDPDLPMTPAEWPEWGNPLASREDFELIGSYCPYQNVTPGAYPHILANASLADLRVGYWEPAKWVARLRACQTGEGLVLLNTNMTAGHGGSSGRFQRLEDFAADYAFALTIADKGEVIA